MAIGLGFDAINGEHNRRTLSRILAQPIYRDALLAGKFIASLATLAISLVCLWLLVVGLGVLFLGVPPSWEEIARSLIFLAVSIAYAGVWLAVAMLFSVIFRSPATAALLSLGVWLFMTLLWPMISPVLAQMISPPDIRYLMLGLPSPDTLQWQVALSRLSPNQLYGEAVLAVLSPSTRALGPIFLEQLQGAVIGSALPLQGEPDDRLAAGRRPHRRCDPTVRRHLRGIPAPGGTGVARSRKIFAVRDETKPGAGGLRAIVTTEEQPCPDPTIATTPDLLPRRCSTPGGVAEYCVWPEESGWIIAFDGERFGPYEARNHAMFSAIDAAHNLGEQGRAATVRLIDTAGLARRRVDPWPRLLSAGASGGRALGAGAEAASSFIGTRMGTAFSAAPFTTQCCERLRLRTP